MKLEHILSEIKKASSLLPSLDEGNRQKTLKLMSTILIQKKELIFSANQLDLKKAKDNKLQESIIDRLTITEKQLQSISLMLEKLSQDPKIVHEIVESKTRSDGLIIEKCRIPLGVIALIFESRPNVIIDAAALAIKSGNALILKGGKEAFHTNEIFFQIVKEAIETHLKENTIYHLTSREEVEALLQFDQYVDLVVPRGGKELVDYVKSKAKMPVMAHDKGLCHEFVDESAPYEMVEPIILNAKTQRPGVCNALESLLIHENWPINFIENLLNKLLFCNVELRGCQKTAKIFPHLKIAKIEDYATEYLDLCLSVKIVKNVEDAVSNIKEFGSHHTDGIISMNEENISYFLNHLDSSCLTINASTRFNDGGELGLGAELGISTQKFHAYGPVGAREMTALRYVVRGTGHIRK